MEFALVARVPTLKERASLATAPGYANINFGSRSRVTRCRGGRKTRSCFDETVGVAAMQQIEDWLKKLGMTEYAQRFGVCGTCW
jgi:hypothetical protein